MGRHNGFGARAKFEAVSAAEIAAIRSGVVQKRSQKALGVRNTAVRPLAHPNVLKIPERPSDNRYVLLADNTIRVLSNVLADDADALSCISRMSRGLRDATRDGRYRLRNAHVKARELAAKANDAFYKMGLPKRLRPLESAWSQNSGIVRLSPCVKEHILTRAQLRDAMPGQLWVCEVVLVAFDRQYHIVLNRDTETLLTREMRLEYLMPFRDYAGSPKRTAMELIYERMPSTVAWRLPHDSGIATKFHDAWVDHETGIVMSDRMVQTMLLRMDRVPPPRCGARRRV